jgi:transmembrane sensor
VVISFFLIDSINIFKQKLPFFRICAGIGCNLIGVIGRDLFIMHTIDKMRELADLLEEREQMDVLEQISEAVINVDRIRQVNVPEAFWKVSNRSLKGDRRGFYVRQLSNAAAILFLPLLGFAIWQYYLTVSDRTGTPVIRQEITNPPGTRSHLILPDGSHVWLNAESTLRYQRPFLRNTRKIFLTGQAFFHVQKNPDIPFIVRAGNVEINVLGTEFDVNAFPENNDISVVLTRGEISLTARKKNQTDLKTAVLQPGDRAVVGRQSAEIQLLKGVMDKYIAWHKGRLVFDETPMEEVARQLERWYGVRVVIRDADILNYHFSTTFENESLYQVLDLLKLASPIETTYQSAHYDPQTESYTRAVIFISKKSK